MCPRITFSYSTQKTWPLFLKYSTKCCACQLKYSMLHRWCSIRHEGIVRGDWPFYGWLSSALQVPPTIWSTSSSAPITIHYFCNGTLQPGRVQTLSYGESKSYPIEQMVWLWLEAFDIKLGFSAACTSSSNLVFNWISIIFANFAEFCVKTTMLMPIWLASTVEFHHLLLFQLLAFNVFLSI